MLVQFKQWRRNAALALLVLVVVFATVVASARVQASGNPNPGVVPNTGQRYGELAAQWWQWAYSFPAADVPFFNTGGAVDISAHQSGHVWFLAGANNGPTTRSGTVPSGTYLFYPMANLVNDYPCPAEFNFEPGHSESLVHFLQRTGSAFLGDHTGHLFAEIDGNPLVSLESYRNTSHMFMFTADPVLNTLFDPCITGSSQQGVSVGYWLLLEPLSPGTHTLHFGSNIWGQDVTYHVTVTGS